MAGERGREGGAEVSPGFFPLVLEPGGATRRAFLWPVLPQHTAWRVASYRKPSRKALEPSSLHRDTHSWSLSCLLGQHSHSWVFLGGSYFPRCQKVPGSLFEPQLLSTLLELGGSCAGDPPIGVHPPGHHRASGTPGCP